MARPRKTEKRERQLNVKLTAREHERLGIRAASCGMRLFDYARARLFAESRIAARQAPAAPHLDPLFHSHLSRLGNLLNQITRRLNTLDLPPPPTLEPLLQEIRALLNKGIAGDR